MVRSRENRRKTESDRKGPRQAYHLTCSNCRTRKMKCDAGQPECGICKAYGDRCLYDKVPPMSQIRAMADRISELEDLLSKSQSPNPLLVDATIDPAPSSNSQQESPYYQSTSAVQEPVTTIEPQSSIVTESLRNVTSVPMTEDQLQFWEETAVQTCATYMNLSSNQVDHLLKTHWTWVHPAFMFVSKPHFLRDAASGGPNFSPLLLSVICLHSTRFTDHNLNEELLAKTRLLLSPDLHKEHSLPLIQALLQLSARDFGKGSFSQAWLYSGMAFRLAVDLGIFRKPNKAVANSESQGVHQQLAWSCYLWDKSMSLYLGRVPSLPAVPEFDPPPIDNVTENAPWKPYYGNEKDNQPLTCMISHTRSCFSNFCRLAVIINDILFGLYGSSHTNDASSFLNQTRQRLEGWRANTPPYLKIDPHEETCPPPHILTQNLLYHATEILLHRPFRSSSSCKTTCQDAAKAVEHLLLLFEKAFGFSHVTYLMAYCAYTAATVAVQDMNENIDGSQQNVNIYLRALYGCRTSCPGIQRSIDIILKSFDRPKPVTNPPQNEAPTTEVENLPAFPFNRFDQGLDLMATLDPLPFGGLDSFALEWASIPGDQFDDLFN